MPRQGELLTQHHWTGHQAGLLKPVLAQVLDGHSPEDVVSGVVERFLNPPLPAMIEDELIFWLLSAYKEDMTDLVNRLGKIEEIHADSCSVCEYPIHGIATYRWDKKKKVYQHLFCMPTEEENRRLKTMEEKPSKPVVKTSATSLLEKIRAKKAAENKENTMEKKTEKKVEKKVEKKIEKKTNGARVQKKSEKGKGKGRKRADGLTISKIVYDCIKTKKTYDQTEKEVKKHFPDSKFNKKHWAWYNAQMKS